MVLENWRSNKMLGNQESVYLRTCWASSLLFMDRALSGTKMGWKFSCRWCESTRQAKVNMWQSGASSSPINAMEIRKIRKYVPDKSRIEAIAFSKVESPRIPKPATLWVIQPASLVVMQRFLLYHLQELEHLRRSANRFMTAGPYNCVDLRPFCV